jgi:hypothetical protein
MLLVAVLVVVLVVLTEEVARVALLVDEEAGVDGLSPLIEVDVQVHDGARIYTTPQTSRKMALSSTSTTVRNLGQKFSSDRLVWICLFQFSFQQVQVPPLRPNSEYTFLRFYACAVIGLEYLF